MLFLWEEGGSRFYRAALLLGGTAATQVKEAVANALTRSTERAHPPYAVDVQLVTVGGEPLLQVTTVDVHDEKDVYRTRPLWAAVAALRIAEFSANGGQAWSLMKGGYLIEG